MNQSFRGLIRFRAIIALAAAAVTVTASAAGAAPAGASTTTGWQVFQTFGQRSEVTAETATSATNAWAVGITAQSANPNALLVWHWNGSAWTSIPVPAQFRAVKWIDNSLVAATSANDMWVVVNTTEPASPIYQSGYVLHWNGTAWNSVVRLGTNIGSVIAVKASDYWAFGYDTTGSARWHFTASGWTREASPWALSASASSYGGTAWAIGYNASQTNALVQRLSAGSWQTVTVPVSVPSGGNTGPVTVHVDGANNVWVFVCVQVANACTTVAMMHFNGTGWSRVYEPFTTTDGYSSVITNDGNGGVWFDYPGSASLHDYNYHTGKWSQYSFPPSAVLPWDMAWIPGGQSVWGGGAVASGSTYLGAIFKFGP